MAPKLLASNSIVQVHNTEFLKKYCHIYPTMAEEDQRSPLLLLTPEDHKRTGNEWTAVAHIITVVVGSGVLSLAWSFAQLGWIAGPLVMLFFAGVTIVSTSLVSDCYISTHPDHGGLVRNRTFIDAVKLHFGSRSVFICGFFQQLSYIGAGVSYTVTAAISLSAIQRSNCFHRKGHEDPCEYGHTFYMFLFGATQILFSQIPNFHELKWLSVISAIMSFTYSSIGFTLGISKTIENGSMKGSIGGIPQVTYIGKFWKVSQALGDIAFGFPYTTLVLQIQDTLKSPPPESQTIKKASMTAVSLTTFFYLCCGGFGYAAFGNHTPGNLLTGFGFYEPYWLIDFSNACIAVHLIGGYQMYSQNVFALVEGWLAQKYPDNCLIHKSFLSLNLLRLCVRTSYVVFITWIAYEFPYFNQVLGLCGAIGFWPLTIYFPLGMYTAQMKLTPWTRKWIILHTLSMICLAVGLIALVGSVQGLISAKLSS